MTEWSKITADPILVPAFEPASPAPSIPARRTSSRGLKSVLGASVLAAVLASASTVGILVAPTAQPGAPAAAGHDAGRRAGPDRRPTPT